MSKKKQKEKSKTEYINLATAIIELLAGLVTLIIASKH